MSFIRCLSNPEGLYIWHDVHGFVAITGREIPKNRMVMAPVKDWYKLLRGCIKEGWGWDETPVRVGRLTISEVFIPSGPRVDWGAKFKDPKYKASWFRRNRKRFNLPADWLEKNKKHKPFWHTPGDFKVQLEIREKGRPKPTIIRMWRTTWEYIVNHERCWKLAKHRSKG